MEYMQQQQQQQQYQQQHNQHQYEEQTVVKLTTKLEDLMAMRENLVSFRGPLVESIAEESAVNNDNPFQDPRDATPEGLTEWSPSPSKDDEQIQVPIY